MYTKDELSKIMKDKDDCVKKESVSEFTRLLDAFKEQLNYLEEHSSVINNKVNLIEGTCSELNKDLKTKEDIRSGILGELWRCIDLMKEHNDILSESRKSLTKLVG